MSEIGEVALALGVKPDRYLPIKINDTLFRLSLMRPGDNLRLELAFERLNGAMLDATQSDSEKVTKALDDAIDNYCMVLAPILDTMRVPDQKPLSALDLRSALLPTHMISLQKALRTLEADADPNFKPVLTDSARKSGPRRSSRRG